MTKTVTTGKATDLITFTRSTTGTYLDSVKYGDELVTNGTFDTDTSSWTAYRNATLSTDSSRLKVLASSTTAGGSASQQITTKVGHTYKLSVDVVEIQSGQTARIAVGSASGDLGSGLGTDIINDNGVAVGTQVYYFTATTTSPFIIVCAQTNTEKHVLFDNVSVKEIIGNQGTSGEPLLRTANTNEPRIEYDLDGNLKGLLIEEQRTNKLTYSQDFTQSEWLKQEVSVATAPVAAPDGTMTATHVVKTGSNGHLVDVGSVTTSDRHSIWARSVSGTGTIHIAYHASASLVTLTEEWQRFDVQCNNINNYAVNFRGDATLTECYIWGSQAETGSFPTSYIPTSGSTVTRNADVATINVSEFEYNTNEGSISMEIVPPSNNSGEQQWILGSNTNSARWAYTNAGFDRAIAYDGVNTFGGEDLQPSTINKIATGTDQSTAVIYVNGESLDGSQATNGNIASLTTIFYLGGNFSTGNVNLGGHIKSIKYYPVRLTDNQLKALTQ